MANNRLYLEFPGLCPDDPIRKVLLAKGWGSGWQLWEPETLISRLEIALEDSDIQGSNLSQTTEIRITTEADETTGPGAVLIRVEDIQKDSI